MNKPGKYVPEYLSFTRKERTGIITIMVLILLFILLPFLFPFFIKSKEVNPGEFEKEIAGLSYKKDSSTGYTENRYDNSNTGYYQRSEKNDNSRQQQAELFYFDPNTLSVAGWMKLGVREKTAKTIQNYIGKGGRFNKPEDIGKIWGLHPADISRLLQYVRMESNSGNGYSNSKPTAPFKKYEKPTYTIEPVDINKADSSAFILLPGIGSKLANRIINFREKLGGFYKIEQVAETFALPDSTFQKIKDKLIIGSVELKKLNINDATIDELKVHPYIRYHIANAIVQYRSQHGKFNVLNDLKKMMTITDDMYNKVAPYLTAH